MPQTPIKLAFLTAVDNVDNVDILSEVTLDRDKIGKSGHKNIHKELYHQGYKKLWILWITMIRGGFPRLLRYLRHP